MAQSTQVVQTKMLDYFFSLRKAPRDRVPADRHAGDRRAVRVRVPLPAGDADAAAVDHLGRPGGDQHRPGRRARHLHRCQDPRTCRPPGGDRACGRATGAAFRHQPDAVQPRSIRRFEAGALGAQVRAAGLDPRQITIECTEQQSVADIGALQRQVSALRKLGFGFAVDDAGAGYASFALIAALRPTVIKIDRDIVHGIGHDDAKQALVEAFVSFGRRIGARLLAEGIERRADLAALSTARGRARPGLPARQAGAEPAAPRRTDGVQRKTAGRAASAKDAVSRPARVPSRA